MPDAADDAYYLEPVTLDDDDDDDYTYEEVEVEDGEEEEPEGPEAEDEDLEQALLTLRTKEDGGAGAAPKEELPPRSVVTRRPEVLDDFIRNVLLKMGMTETLDMFQREWYRLTGEGKISEVDMGTVPDIYLRNQQLGARRRTLQTHRARAEKSWLAAVYARAVFERTLTLLLSRSRSRSLLSLSQVTSCATCRLR